MRQRLSSLCVPDQAALVLQIAKLVAHMELQFYMHSPCLTAPGLLQALRADNILLHRWKPAARKDRHSLCQHVHVALKQLLGMHVVVGVFQLSSLQAHACLTDAYMLLLAWYLPSMKSGTYSFAIYRLATG